MPIPYSRQRSHYGGNHGGRYFRFWRKSTKLLKVGTSYNGTNFENANPPDIQGYYSDFTSVPAFDPNATTLNASFTTGAANGIAPVAEYDFIGTYSPIFYARGASFSSSFHWRRSFSIYGFCFSS